MDDNRQAWTDSSVKLLQESTKDGVSQDRSCKTQPAISRATAEEAIHEEGAVAMAMS